MTVKVERMLPVDRDIEKVSIIASENFSGFKNLKDAQEFICLELGAYPMFQIFVALFELYDNELDEDDEDEDKDNDILPKHVVGYIVWEEHGGFRPNGAFWELKQMATEKEYRRNGVGKALIRVSFEEIQKSMIARGSWVKTVKITTGEKNKSAQRLYERVLGAKIESIINSPYRDGEKEVEMYVRFSNDGLIIL